ncbi:MAG: quinohemoprotein amine dehydrogenase maturation protein, partial [Proteobacteria bacterium]|nr:quinohemoprotein amine dehydrogenase maturation protein [Pseudomonadota bacterium]
MKFNRANGHVVRFDGRAMLLHVPTTALFELDDLGRAVVDLSERAGEIDRDGLSRSLADRFASTDVENFLQRLEQLEILQSPGRVHAVNPQRVQVEEFPLSTLVLNVNTGCNLGCTYCYKEDLAVPALGQRMDFATASRSVDLLLQQASERDRINIVFFGGEPLTNMPLIRQVVEYARRTGDAQRKKVDFSLTTNATLLTEEIIGFFDANRFGISVSMDGPRAIHDRNRRTVGGKGTYAVVARKVRLLLDSYRSRPVGARVTLTSGTTEVEQIHAHLRGELGFHEVGYAPVTAAEDAGHGLTHEELEQVHAAFERMGEAYRVAAIQGRSTGFSNLPPLMTDLHEARRKALPCGAGVGLLSVDKSGG